MPRSVKKGPFINERLLLRVEAMNSRGEKKVVKTWARASTISPEFVGHTVAVHMRHDFVVFPGLEVVVNDLADEVPRFHVVHGGGLYAKLIRVQLRADSITLKNLGNAENYAT